MLRRVATILAAAGLVAGCSAGGSSPDSQVVFANYGGSIHDAYVAAYFEDFTDDTGIEVVSADADPGRYVAMARSGSSEWDTMDADGFAVATYVEEGLVEELPESVPRSDMVDPKYQDYTAGGYAQSFVLAYRESAFETAPTSWADMWDTEKFPGKRGWPSYYIGTAEAALLADGVSPDDLYPLDFDRAFAKLDELKPEMTFYDSYAAVIQGLQSGSVDMALVPNGRVSVLREDDPDIKIMWEENLFYPWSGFTIPEGAPNPDGMAQLLEYMQDPERQAEFAERSYYAPTLREAYQHVSPEVAKELPGTDEHRELAVEVDTEILAGQTDEYIERYGDWVAE